jgi:CBS-domain-containing membrane protein
MQKLAFLKEKGRPGVAKIRRAAVTAAGGASGIAIMIGFVKSTGHELAAVPFTTSIVLVMSAPESPPAQPFAVAGGHFLSTLSGFTVLWLAGSSPWLASAAVGLSIFLMQVTGTLHPPAGLDALLVVIAHPSWTFLLDPILAGAGLLIAFAYAFHRVAGQNHYPMTSRGKACT